MSETCVWCGLPVAPHTAWLDCADALKAALVRAEREREDELNAHLAWKADAHDLRRRLDEAVEKLWPHAVHVDPMSWHMERMVCDLCGSSWNNGAKRNEPATPETHDAKCLFAREIVEKNR